MRRDGHKTVTAVTVHRLRAGLRNRIVRARERDAIHHHQTTGVSGDVNALPQAHRAKQARVDILAKLLHQGLQRGFTLQKNIQVAVLTHVLGGALGGALRGEQPQGTTLGRLAQLAKSLQLALVHAKSRGLQIPGYVHDALLAVVEGRTHIDARPAGSPLPLQTQGAGGHIEGVTHRQGRAR